VTLVVYIYIICGYQRESANTRRASINDVNRNNVVNIISTYDIISINDIISIHHIVSIDVISVINSLSAMDGCDRPLKN
jgi:hypothetical protein